MRFLSLKGLFKFMLVAGTIFVNMLLLFYLSVATLNALHSMLVVSPLLAFIAVLLVICASIFLMLLILYYILEALP